MIGYSRLSARQIAAALCTATLALVIAVPGVCNATPDVETKKLVRIEEDWVVLIKNPDHKIASPQVLICMTPDGQFLADYALLEINHGSRPDWLAGGIQLQGWKGVANVSLFNCPKTAVLDRGYDRIKFTTSIEAKGDGYTTFAIKNGKSKTWGTFGTTSTTPIQVRVPSTRTDLTGYSRTHSVKQTHVTHGAHRVTMMYQRRVRYYFSDGTAQVDDAYKILHRFQSLVQDMTLDEWERTKTDYTYEDTGA